MSWFKNKNMNKKVDILDMDVQHAFALNVDEVLKRDINENVERYINRYGDFDMLKYQEIYDNTVVEHIPSCNIAEECLGLKFNVFLYGIEIFTMTYWHSKHINDRQVASVYAKEIDMLHEILKNQMDLPLNIMNIKYLGSNEYMVEYICDTHNIKRSMTIKLGKYQSYNVLEEKIKKFIK